jgi:hypothetical protein
MLKPSLRLYIAPVLHHPPHPHPITKPAFSTYKPQQHPALQPHRHTMHKIAPLPGLKFYLLEFRGWLKYTLTRPGKAPKVFKLCDADLDDNEVDKPEKLKHGLDASAVGIQLRLLKNDGVLKVEFEGKDRAVANWTFNGLALVNGGRMVAAAATQTDVEVKMEEVEVEVKNEETQTNVVVMQSTGFQTKAVTVSSAEVQTTLPDVPLHRQLPGLVEILGPFIDTPTSKKFIEDTLSMLKVSMRCARPVLERNAAARTDPAVLARDLKEVLTRMDLPRNQLSKEGVWMSPTDIYMQAKSNRERHLESDEQEPEENTTTTNPDLKRKSPATPVTERPLHKRAKSTHDSEPWPRHIYMECNRTTPLNKGGVGVLHIDLEVGLAWFEGWHGAKNTRVYERKQVYLSDSSSKQMSALSYDPNANIATACVTYKTKQYWGARSSMPTHSLMITHTSAKMKAVLDFEAECSAPGWRMYGLETAYFGSDKPDDSDMIPINDPRVVVDALAHCVDRATGREPAHAPDLDQNRMRRAGRWREQFAQGKLDERRMKAWQYAVGLLRYGENYKIMSSNVDDEWEKRVAEEESALAQAKQAIFSNKS